MYLNSSRPPDLYPTYPIDGLSAHLANILSSTLNLLLALISTSAFLFVDTANAIDKLTDAAGTGPLPDTASAKPRSQEKPASHLSASDGADQHDTLLQSTITPPTQYSSTNPSRPDRRIPVFPAPPPASLFAALPDGGSPDSQQLTRH